jgi:hypothetical protein
MLHQLKNKCGRTCTVNRTHYVWLASSFGVQLEDLRTELCGQLASFFVEPNFQSRVLYGGDIHMRVLHYIQGWKCTVYGTVRFGRFRRFLPSFKFETV